MGGAPKWVLFLVVSITLLSATRSPAWGAASAQRGWLAVQGERQLDSHRADELFVPGSVLKLVVVATALHHLGPGYRVVTELRPTGKWADGPSADGTLAVGTLAGDLVWVAAGDPTWNHLLFADDPYLPLRQMVGSLKDRGLRRIEGDLVIDLSHFPGRSLPLGRPLGDLMAAFGAPAAAVAVDQAAAVVRIAPGSRPGAAGSARSLTPGLEVEAQLITVGAERHGKGTVDFLPDWQQPRLLVRGEYPLSEPSYRVEVPMPAAELHAGHVLRRILAEEGIELRGQVRLSSTAPTTGEPWASWSSPPLSAWLEPILSDSRNWWAEMLLRVVARAVVGEGRYDEGLAIEGRFLTAVVGVEVASFRLDDASGQSVYNLLTPRTVVELLRFVAGQPWGRKFIDALARPGRGTLKHATDLPPLAAKTGTLTVARGFAGYIDPRAELPVIFAVFTQHSPASAAAQRSGLFAAVRGFRSRVEAGAVPPN